jgi:hypothetical protein
VIEGSCCAGQVVDAVTNILYSTVMVPCHRGSWLSRVMRWRRSIKTERKNRKRRHIEQGAQICQASLTVKGGIAFVRDPERHVCVCHSQKRTHATNQNLRRPSTNHTYRYRYVSLPYPYRLRIQIYSGVKADPFFSFWGARAFARYSSFTVGYVRSMIRRLVADSLRLLQ